MTDLPFVVRAADAVPVAMRDDVFRFLVTANESGGTYSVCLVDVPVGGGPTPHVHDVAEEWFYVLAGAPLFHVAGQQLELSSGDFVHIPRGTEHWFQVGGSPVRLLSGFAPAGDELALRELTRPV
jgi:quercetin dioxygenase-like cupin family protein